MNLVSPLMSGMSGAENGTAEIYTRGTSTRATYYTDFEATGQVSTGADVALDSNGRAEVYVNELCDVLVKDSLGAQIANFTIGDAAPNVEYRGHSFTGVAYDTAASGAGAAYPLSLQAILDRWQTNSGAIDWKVLVGSSSLTLRTALGAVSGMFFNVKDPAYGALGDGATDDAAAINAANTAAATSGGVLYFPPGTYIVKSAITLSAKVSILGCGPNASIIKIDHATANLLSVTGSASVIAQQIEGVSLGCQQANTGKLIVTGASTLLSLRSCYLGGTNANGYMVDGSAMGGSGWFAAYGCTFATASTNRTMLLMGSSLVTLDGCLFKTPASYTPAVGAYGAVGGLVYATNLVVNDCIFDNTSSAAGTFNCIQANTASIAGTVTNCTFLSGTGATIIYIALGTYSSAANFSESNNFFGTDTAYYYTCAGASLGAQVRLNTRERRVKHQAVTTTTPSIASDQYGVFVLTSTEAGNVTVSGTMPPEGSTLKVYIRNSDGSNRDFSFDTGLFLNLAAKTVVAGSIDGMMSFAVIDVATPRVLGMWAF